MNRSGETTGTPPGASQEKANGLMDKAAVAGRRATRDLSARREEILDAATELFAEHGYSDAVTQALAERLGVGKGTLYRHFPSKRDLFLASVDRVMRRLREHVDGWIADAADPLDKIALAVRAFLNFFAEHPRYVELLVQERALFKDRTRPTYVVHREANATRWHDVYRALSSEGRIRDLPAERFTEVVGNLCYGTVIANYFSGRQRPSEDQARDIMDVVFFGILGDAERRKRGCAR
jgi:AcrR family transcriptional regulator